MYCLRVTARYARCRVNGRRCGWGRRWCCHRAVAIRLVMIQPHNRWPWARRWAGNRYWGHAICTLGLASTCTAAFCVAFWAVMAVPSGLCRMPCPRCLPCRWGKRCNRCWTTPCRRYCSPARAITACVSGWRSCCIWKHCGFISKRCRGRPLVGWPGCAIHWWAGRCNCCIRHLRRCGR